MFRAMSLATAGLAATGFLVSAPVSPRFARPTIRLQSLVLAPTDEVASADFNGDGLVDVIITRLGAHEGTKYPITILLNKGNGRFVDATKSIFVGAPPITQHPRQIVVADFNGDGRADAFIADHGTDLPPFPGYQSTLILSQPHGKLVDATGNLPQEIAFTHSAAAADVDVNGTVDLYFGRVNDRPEILLNDGTGHFTPSPNALSDLPPYPVGWPYVGEAFVDANGDGAPDLVITQDELWGTNRVMLNNGKGHFSLVATDLPGGRYVYNSISLGVATGDLNGDGHADVVIASTHGNPYYIGTDLQVLISNDDGTFHDETAAWMPNQPPDSDRWTAFPQLVDLNGDGKLDLVTHEDGFPVPPAPAYLNDGNGHFTPLTTPAYTRGMWTFVNDKPHQPARDVLAISELAPIESYIFYRRLK